MVARVVPSNKWVPGAANPSDTLSPRTPYSNIRVSGQMRAADGAVGAPSFTFHTEQTTGFWLNAAGDLRGSVAGSLALRVTADHVALGIGAAPTGQFSTAIGDGALGTASGANNTAVGAGALTSTTTGDLNTACGSGALFSNTDGRYNVAVGQWAMLFSVSTQKNTSIGKDSLINLITGNRNVVVGYESGGLYGGGAGTNLTSLSDSVLLGADARPSADGNTNEVVIGFTAVGAGSNTVTLGNTSVTETWLQGGLKVGTYDSIFATNDKIRHKFTHLLADGEVGLATGKVSHYHMLAAVGADGGLTADLTTLNGLAFYLEPDTTWSPTGGTMNAILSQVWARQGGTVAFIRGLYSSAANAGAGAVTNLRGIQIDVNNWGAGTVTTAAGLYIASPGGSGTITTYYGLYIANADYGTTRWQIYCAGTEDSYFGGPIQFSGDVGLTRLAAGVLSVDDAGSGRGTIVADFTFAHIYVKDGSTAQGSLGATPAKVTGFTTDGASNDCTAAAASDKITITRTGVYQIHFYICFTGTPNVDFQFFIRFAGTETILGAEALLNGAGDITEVSIEGMLDISGTGDIEVYAEADSPGSEITPVQMHLSVLRVAGT